MLEEEKITSFSGQLYKSGKELFIYYVDENDKKKKVSTGYCKKIDEASFYDELEKFLDKTKLS